MTRASSRSHALGNKIAVRRFWMPAIFREAVANSAPLHARGILQTASGALARRWPEPGSTFFEQEPLPADHKLWTLAAF